MNRTFGSAHYTTKFAEDKKDGCACLELHELLDGKNSYVAEVTYWDASAQFYLATRSTEIPLEIVEELIAEAKSVIRTQ